MAGARAYDLQIKVRAPWPGVVHWHAGLELLLSPRLGSGEAASHPLPPPESAELGCLPCSQLMMIGDTTVGKTSLLVRYADDDFNESVLATIGIDFKIKVPRPAVRL